MKYPQRTLSTLLTLGALAALPTAACAGAQDAQGTAQGTEPQAPAADRRDAIVASGVLAREKDCQLLRTPAGQTYVLLGRLSQETAGGRVQVTGRRGGRTACRQGPSILVESVRPEALVPAARQPGQPFPPTGNMAFHEGGPMDDARLGKAKRLQVTGTLTREGVECPLLRTAKGRTYTLAGDLKGFQSGDRVTVTGTPAQASICQQGMTIEVESVRRPR
jgi:hypothetical protein